MIEEIKLRFGRTPGSEGESIVCTPVTVFVGPNNSGKSKVLSEIERAARSGQRLVDEVILSEFSVAGLSPEDAALEVAKVEQQPNVGEMVPIGSVVVGVRYGRQHVDRARLTHLLQFPDADLHAYCVWYLSNSTLSLDGASRINLINDQVAGDLQNSPQTSLQVLFRDDGKRHEVRRIVHEAFGVYFVVDPTNLGTLRIGLSTRAPEDDREERGIHDEAVRFHSESTPIGSASDGVKAFVGITTELMAGDPRVVLIDEPEAFLHPSLASKLGLEISRLAMAADKRVFVSTHSPAFVMGCIQSGSPVNIVRLTYRGGVATSRILPSQELLELMRHPLLRSTGVVSGLFYEFVVVTESDADRAFYQEVNERLLQLKSEWGIPNCLFINAQNKQTIQTIIKPLRKLGIPTAGVMDIDVLKDGGSAWSSLLTAANIPELAHGALAHHRTAVKRAMDESGRDMKRDGGLAILSAAEREAASNLLDQLSSYGIFVVRGGELESWLTHLRARGHGPSWLVEIFTKMGSDPANENFVRPGDGDVWQFLGSIREWLVNPNRLGIPD